MENRLIFGDNLQILKTIPSESVDLCYIDPPFFSGRDHAAFRKDSGEEVSFVDRWSDMEQYIYWLKERTEEIWRVLKPTGSLYMHCDWHANAYIRVYILDKLSDSKILNEVIWGYSTYLGRVNSLRYFPRKHDMIFVYSKGAKYTFNKADALSNFLETVDGKRWRKYFSNGNKIIENNHPTTDRRFIQYRNKWIREHGRMPNPGEAIYECGGDVITDNWTDIKAVDPKSKERIGYPTQKPLALLERIIKASSNEGDIVLDAFCGSGTTLVAAQRLGRKFIGIDQSEQAIAVSRARLGMGNQASEYCKSVCDIRHNIVN
jgi:DNA modification methylase